MTKMQEISIETTRDSRHRYDITQMQTNGGGTNIWNLYVDGEFRTNRSNYQEIADEIKRIK